jgi:Fe-S cluster assembly iron-binding protein IscA
MLTITPDAANLLVNQRDETGAPNTYGVRLFLPPDEADAELVIAFVSEPLPGDTITDQEGIRAFLAPEILAQLDHATLDATPTNGMPRRLVLRR